MQLNIVATNYMCYWELEMTSLNMNCEFKIYTGECNESFSVPLASL